MSKQQKLLLKAINNPGGLKFEEFRTLLTFHNWVQDRQTGSHQIWYSKDRQRISIQNRNGQAKGEQYE